MLPKGINLPPSMTKGNIRASGLNIIRKETAAIAQWKPYINTLRPRRGVDSRF